MKRFFSTMCIILFFICMLMFPQAVFQGASTGLLLWFNTVLPTLLPFIIISNLLIHTCAIDVIARIISPVLCRFFRVSPYGAFAVLTGFLCGCPMGGKVTADLMKKGCISEKESRYLLSFCNNTSPMFIISYIIWQNLKCPEITLPLLAITLSAPVLLSFFFRIIYRIPKDIIAGSLSQKKVVSKDTTDMLDVCIMNGFETITRIGGYIMLFSICISLVQLIPVKTPLITLILLPSLEVTTGVSMICRASLSTNMKIISALTLASFGGWCAAAQTRAVVQETRLPLSPYIIEKLAAALATSFLTYCYLSLH